MEQQKIAYGLDDIRERYGVGIGKARNIMKSIRAYNKELPMGVRSVPGALGHGKVLYTELYAWEQSFLQKAEVSAK